MRATCPCPPGRLSQIYVLKRRDVTEMMVHEATRLGYKALVVTVDAPRLGALRRHAAAGCRAQPPARRGILGPQQSSPDAAAPWCTLGWACRAGC